MDTEIFEKIKIFTVKEAAVMENEVTPDADLENDLDVSGDDAIEFLNTSLPHAIIV